MKWLLVSMVLVLLVAGCTPEQAPDDAVEDMQQATQEAPPTTNQDMEDRVIYEDEDVSVEVQDNVIVADVSGAVTEDYEVTVSLDEWCIEGQVYQGAVEGMATDSQIIGITIKEGQRVCELYSVSVIDVPMMGQIETKTTYYLNEDISEMWAVVDAMGEVTENYIKLK